MGCLVIENQKKQLKKGKKLVWGKKNLIFKNNDVELNVFYTNSFDVDDIKLNKNIVHLNFFTLGNIRK